MSLMVLESDVNPWPSKLAVTCLASSSDSAGGAGVRRRFPDVVVSAREVGRKDINLASQLLTQDK